MGGHYPTDLKTNILNARGVQYRLKKNYSSLENHCQEVVKMGLFDTITIILLYLSYENRGLHEDARKVISGFIKEADNNPRIDKNILSNYLKS